MKHLAAEPPHAMTDSAPAPAAEPSAIPFRRIRNLEGENRRLRAQARSAADTEHALRERVKELNCLYGISRLVDEFGDDLDGLMAAIASLLPPSWQYPESCCGRIILDGRAFTSMGFRPGVDCQSADVCVYGERVGRIEVHYTEPMPTSDVGRCSLGDEGPFLREERALITAIAERVGRIVERRQTRARLQEALQQVQVERSALQRANTALRELLDQIEHQKEDIRTTISSNVERVLVPVVQALESELPPEQRPYADVLRRSIHEVTAPLTSRLADEFSRLTPTEVHVCNLIRGGLSTKEIARLRHVSPATVSRQRERIRHKLGLTGTSTNLTTYLASLGGRGGLSSAD